MRPRNSLQWVAGSKTPDKVYITRVFNLGTLEEWSRMKNRFTEEKIRQALEDPLPGQWTGRAKRFAEVLFGIKMPDRALIRYHA